MTCQNEINNKRYKKYAVLIGLTLLFLTCFVAMYPVEGKINPNSTLFVNYTTDNSITWNYTYTVTLTKGSLDGTTITDFDTQSLEYTAKELEPNTAHKFCIYSHTGINCEIGQTQESTIDKIIDLTYYFIFFFASLVCIILAYNKGDYKISILGFILSIVGLGLTTSATHPFISVLFALEAFIAILTAFKE